MNHYKSSSSQKLYSKNHVPKSFVNYPKQANVYKPSKSSVRKDPHYNLQYKSSLPSARPNRKPLENYNPYAESRAVKPSFAQDKYVDLNRFYESLKYSLPKGNQSYTVPYYAISEKNSQISELTGFKIVQNGIIIHDETSVDKESGASSCSTAFIEEKSEHYTESVYTLKPCSKEIPLPTFIEVP